MRCLGTFLAIVISMSCPVGAQPESPSTWHGFQTQRVPLSLGESATVVLPKSAAPGRPWVWQFAIYGDNPITGQVNAPGLALLEKGWHVVALPLGNTFGAPSALKKWDELYKVITVTFGLSSKPVLVGLSREGLAIHRWAAMHPQQVGGIYADRAVCDFKSWPGGKLGLGKGSARDWELLIKTYAFASEAEAMAYRENPIDIAGILAKARIPILHVAGEKDDVVPPSENVLVLQSRLKDAGGNLTLITVPDSGHHPHGLADPKPIVDFMLRCAEESAIDEKFQRWKVGLTPEQQAWENVLEANLGSFYLPIYMRDKVEGKETAWDYVADDPNLPRLLIIGDSISRGYTLAARKALAGKVNVHRAPENCGPTANGLKKLNTWLAGQHWDVIHFNFGIHDRARDAKEYEQNLEQIVARLQATGAKLIWARTTPPPPGNSSKFTLEQGKQVNRIADAVMGRHAIPIDDLYSVILPHLKEMQIDDDVHFKPAGYDLLGRKVADRVL